MTSELLKGNLDMLLLAILRDGPRHGYGVIEELRRRSDSLFDLPEGTIYPALHRLERQGVLRSEWAVTGGRRRRMYEITADGLAALAAQATTWQRFVVGVQAVVQRKALPV
jgi:DNA-binding PadR family transcriptional regulator